MKKVLITGMTGLIGGLLRRHMEKLGVYQLSALNRRPVEGVECFQADIGDLEAIKPAFDGKEVVVHLAAQLQDEPQEGLLRTNVIGTYNVYEAARVANVKRVVFASSGSVVRGFEQIPPYNAIADGRYDQLPATWAKITHEMLWPMGLYGASKAWGEALGRHFSDAYGLSVLCVRIGAVRQEDRPAAVRERSIYLSHRDVVQILYKCIEAPEALLFDIFLATSNNKWGYRDMEHARRLLGFKPQDSAETA